MLHLCKNKLVLRALTPTYCFTNLLFHIQIETQLAGVYKKVHCYTLKVFFFSNQCKCLCATFKILPRGVKPLYH